MKNPEKPKTDNIGWIMAFLFPKKGKPANQPLQKPAVIPKPVPPAAGDAVTTNTTHPTQQAEAVKPAAKSAPQIIHSVSAPPAQPIPIKPIKPVKPAATPSSGQSQLTRLSPKPARKPFFKFEAGKTLPAFWTIASVFSFVVNVILIVVLVVLARELFVLKAIVGNDLLGGLFANFIYMDKAHIKTDITVSDTIPISFSLPISQDTVVTLTENTPISGANVRINSGGVTINSAANIILPRGTNLPVHLELNVPVTTSVPIKIKVPVDIPLEQTELHQPFVGLQQVVAPYYWMLNPKIKTAANVDACKSASWFCDWFFVAP
jgi:hypothetical protein